MKTITFLNWAIPILFAIILPPPTLLAWLGVTMSLDLITGVAKAVKNNVPRTSEGFRRTVAKFIQYGGAISIGIILANIAEYKENTVAEQIFTWFSTGMIMFIIYIEIKSILENMIEVSPDSDFTKFFLRPVHNVLSLEFKKYISAPSQNE